MDIERPIKFKCPHCETILFAREDKAGGKALCPSCKKPIDVPEMPQRKKDT